MLSSSFHNLQSNSSIVSCHCNNLDCRFCIFYVNCFPRSTRTQAFWTPHRNTHQTTASTTESIQTPPPVTNISTKATLQPNLLPPPPTTKRMQRMKHSRIVPNRIHQHVVKVDGGDGVTYGEGGGGVTTAEDGCEGCGCFGWLEGWLVVFYGVFSYVDVLTSLDLVDNILRIIKTRTLRQYWILRR